MSKYRTLGQAMKANPEQFQLKKGPNGRNLCRFCGTEVEPPRRTFCSGEITRYSRRKIDGVWKKVIYRQGSGCVHEWCIRSRPRYARQAVFDRDQGICAVCGVQGSLHGDWQADHIIPVSQGGGLCGLEGLRTLCTACHRIETAKLLRKLAEDRKRNK